MVARENEKQREWDRDDLLCCELLDCGATSISDTHTHKQTHTSDLLIYISLCNHSHRIVHDTRSTNNIWSVCVCVCVCFP